MWSRVASMAPLSVLMACTSSSSSSSSSALEPGAGNDPGTQTGTLVVTARLGAVPSHPNASMPSEFTSYIDVRSPQPIDQLSDATVTVTSASGKFPLLFQSQKPYVEWTGSIPSYDEVYVLDVVSSIGTIKGARVDGPDIHVFTRPAEGATIDPKSPMTFAWDSKDQADTTWILIDTTATSGVALRVADSGEHAVAPEDFTRADPHALQHHVILERDNAIPLKGDGASWTVSITNSIDVMMPTP